MNLRLGLLLALLACSKKPEPEYGSVCYVQDFYLAQDADGGALEIADARRGAPLPGAPAGTPKYVMFRRGGTIRVEWQDFDLIWSEELEYAPGSPNAKIIEPLDCRFSAALMLRDSLAPGHSRRVDLATAIAKRA